MSLLGALWRHAVARQETPQVLHFKDARAVVQYACKFLDCTPEVGLVLPVVIVRASVCGNGIQVATILAPSASGTFGTVATTVGPTGPGLLPGDLAAWRLLEHNPEAARWISDDPRCAWMGLITMKMKPTLSIVDGWRGIQRFS